MESIYNLASLLAAFKILSADYSVHLFYNVVLFSLFVLLYNQSMAFVPLKRLLL